MSEIPVCVRVATAAVGNATNNEAVRLEHRATISGDECMVEFDQIASLDYDCFEEEIKQLGYICSKKRFKMCHSDLKDSPPSMHFEFFISLTPIPRQKVHWWIILLVLLHVAMIAGYQFLENTLPSYTPYVRLLQMC